MKTYWNTLNERERGLVAGAAICVFIYVYYLFLYAPLSNQIALKSKLLVEKKQTLSWMKQVIKQKNQLKKKEDIENSQLLTLLARQLKHNQNLAFPYQLQQTATGEIQLSFDAVPFNSFMLWLMKLNNQYAITLKQFEANKMDTAGMTKILIIISG